MELGLGTGEKKEGQSLVMVLWKHQAVRSGARLGIAQPADPRERAGCTWSLGPSVTGRPAVGTGPPSAEQR